MPHKNSISSSQREKRSLAAPKDINFDLPGPTKFLFCDKKVKKIDA